MTEDWRLVLEELYEDKKYLFELSDEQVLKFFSMFEHEYIIRNMGAEE